MTEALLLTAVRLRHLRDRADAWLRFGEPIAIRRRGRQAIAYFGPGAVFAYVDWRAGDHGTVAWSLAIVRTGTPGERLQTWPGVMPGGELLLSARGIAAVRRAFAEIDAVEASGFSADSVSLDHWRCASNRVCARGEVRGPAAATLAAARVRQGLLEG